MVANHVLCQLSYTPENEFEISNFKFEILGGWLRGRDLNPRPLGYEPNELPDCSTPRQGQTKHPESSQFQSPDSSGNITSNPKSKIGNLNSLVGLGRIELPTSRLSGVRSNQLSYRPKTLLRIPFIRTSGRIWPQKKSHTSHQVRSVSTVDAPEGRVASVAIITCLRSTCLPNY